VTPATLPVVTDAPDRDFSERLVDAAVEAEFETGRREETVREAQAHILIRIPRIILGFLVVILGIVALPLPGPGWLIILAGLGILSLDFAWAARLIRYIRRTIPGVPEDGKVPGRTWLIMIVIMSAATACTIWYYFFGGQDTVSGWWDQIRG